MLYTWRIAEDGDGSTLAILENVQTEEGKTPGWYLFQEMTCWDLWRLGSKLSLPYKWPPKYPAGSNNSTFHPPTVIHLAWVRKWPQVPYGDSHLDWRCGPWSFQLSAVLFLKSWVLVSQKVGAKMLWLFLLACLMAKISYQGNSTMSPLKIWTFVFVLKWIKHLWFEELGARWNSDVNNGECW